jgi:predicted nucleic acid-binding protein
LDAQLTAPAKAYVGAALNSGATCLSVISKMEILGWNFASPQEELQARAFVNDLTLVDLSDDIVEKTIALRRQLPKIKLPDAIIAATALVHSITLLSRNTADFSRVPGLEVVNPMDA